VSLSVLSLLVKKSASLPGAGGVIGGGGGERIPQECVEHERSHIPCMLQI